MSSYPYLQEVEEPPRNPAEHLARITEQKLADFADPDAYFIKKLSEEILTLCTASANEGSWRREIYETPLLRHTHRDKINWKGKQLPGPVVQKLEEWDFKVLYEDCFSPERVPVAENLYPVVSWEHHKKQ